MTIIAVVLRCLLVLLSIAAASMPLHAAEPFVRVDIVTPEPIVPGQQVQIQVDVLVPNFFLSSPRFPVFDLPDAVVTLPDARAQNLVETIDGESFSGIRRRYIVTPQVAGDFVLPPATITFTYAAVPGQSANGSVALPPTRFTVAGAPGAPPGQAATAAKVTMTQALDRDPKSLKAGDTLVRTITVEADGMQAMMIPAPTFDAPQDVRVYPHDPVLSDDTGIGQGPIGGKRIDRVTYAFERPGDYILPAIEIGWYDPATRKNEVVQAPAVAVSVAEAAAFKPAIAPPAPAAKAAPVHDKPWLRSFTWAVAGAAALAVLATLAVRVGPKLRARRQARRRAEEKSEAAYFRRFEGACRSGDGRAIYSALDAWTRRADIASVSSWLAIAGDEATRAEFERLQGAVFAGKPQPFDASKLAAGLSRTRRAWQAKQGRDMAATSALPALNP